MSSGINKVGLVLREEPEGHGILFVAYGDGPNMRDAIALVSKSAMEADNPLDELSECIEAHSNEIAKALIDGHE